MNDIVRELLTKRGLTDPEEIREFLDPHPRTAYDPRLLYGMQEAVSVILEAVRRGDKIVVYGDYDADGVTATVIMMTILRALGAKAPSFYIPSRFDEGYGLNEQAIVKLVDLGVDMIITVDCGAVSYFEVETAKEYGIQVVVTDHHNCADGVADTIVLDPKQEGETYPYRDLAGCGVAYKLALALRDAAGLDKKITNDLLDMVAIGTVADVVPLTGENRSLVKYGLRKINTGSRIGLNMLIDRIYRKNGDPGNRRYPVDAGRIGFGIGPHVNAAGRMEDASLGVRLFLAKTPEEAYPYVEKMRTLNEERKSIQDRTERHILAYCAEELEHDLFPVLVPQTSHEGTNGVVAGRLRERFHKPVAILAGSQEEYYTATCRGIEGLDLHAVLSTQSHLFERFGGHAMACGFTIRKEYVSALKEGLEAVMKEILLAQPSLFEKHVPYDMILQPEQIDLPLAEELQLLAPFGKDNPNPAFLLESVKLQEYDVIGNGRALRLRIASAHGGVAGICFGSEEKISKMAELCRTADRLQITAHIDINEFNGRKSVQLMIVDISENKQE